MEVDSDTTTTTKKKNRCWRWYKKTKDSSKYKECKKWMNNGRSMIKKTQK